MTATVERTLTPADLPGRMSRRALVTESGCWLWLGAVQSNGYGSVGIGGKRTGLTHRVAYEALVGPIPEGMVIDHTCHNDTGCEGGKCIHRRCVNPAHLEAVDSRTNTARSHNTLTDATHCPRGHSYADAYVRPNGRRECRACRDEKRSSYYARERAKYAAEHPVVQRRRKDGSAPVVLAPSPGGAS